MEPTTEYLLWLDLETTGLDPFRASIIEAAWFVRSKRFRSRADQSIKLESFLLNCEDARWDIPAYEMHKASGLYESSLKSENRDRFELDRLIVASLPQQSEPYRLYLAGSSVHFDMSFIQTHLPALAKKLHYRLFDVTAQKQLFESLGHEFPELKEKPHRAVQDILTSYSLYERCVELAKPGVISDRL